MLNFMEIKNAGLSNECIGKITFDLFSTRFNKKNAYSKSKIANIIE